MNLTLMTGERLQDAMGLDRGVGGRTLDLTATLALARDLAGLLVPVRPRAEFRAELYHSLLASARQQQAQRVLAIGPQADAATSPLMQAPRWITEELGRADRRWVLGAAAASVVGLLAYLRHHRERKAVA